MKTDIEQLREKIERKPQKALLLCIVAILALIGLEYVIETVLGIWIPGFDFIGIMDVVTAIKEIIQSFG